MFYNKVYVKLQYSFNYRIDSDFVSSFNEGTDITKEEDLMETSTHTVDHKTIWVALISISAAIILGLLGLLRTVVQAHTASELIYIYTNNESSADARHIARTVQITGTIYSVQQNNASKNLSI